MRVAAAFVCDAATVRDGLGHVLGAGITHLLRPRFPAPARVTLFLMLEFPAGEVPERGELDLSVEHVASGQVIGGVEGTFASQPPAQSTPAVAMMPIALPLDDVGLPEPGQYDFVVTLTGLEGQIRVPVWAVLSTPGDQ